MDTEASHTASAGATPVVEFATSRPRVLGWVRSAALLDGDWGTSIAYVLGISFALAGYQSFWHLLMMLALTALVAVNYIAICRLHPNGGGVYSSVYHRSKNLAVIGALLLGADYIITMSLSILDGCHYLGLGDASPIWAMGIIVAIGLLNWYGPKHTGGLALGISISKLVTIIVIVVAFVAAFVAGDARPAIQPIQGGFMHNWAIFAGIILSISGIEAISNMTGLMKDPARNSRKAILAVLSKVVIATIILAFAMHAIPGIGRTDHTEDMVRFVGETYIGHWFGWIIGGTLGLLLISAGNTALNDLINIQFLMAVDQELPIGLRKLNRHGVPVYALVVATVAPVIILLIINDVLTLSHLYAIGVVGAITINVASTGTDRTIQLKGLTRIGMIISAVVLFFIEITIGTQKHEAAIFAGAILVLGLGARFIAQRYKKPVTIASPGEIPVMHNMRRQGRKAPTARYLVAIKDINDRLLNFAVQEARLRNAMLFVLRVREIKVDSLPERLAMGINGVERRFQEACEQGDIDYQIISIPSNEAGYTIAEQAATLGIDRVIVGTSSRSLMESMLKGSVLRSLGHLLPEDVQVLIFG